MLVNGSRLSTRRGSPSTLGGYPDVQFCRKISGIPMTSTTSPPELQWKTDQFWACPFRTNGGLLISSQPDALARKHPPLTDVSDCKAATNPRSSHSIRCPLLVLGRALEEKPQKAPRKAKTRFTSATQNATSHRSGSQVFQFSYGCYALEPVVTVFQQDGTLCIALNSSCFAP